MASTIRAKKDTKEFFDEPDVLTTKVKEFALAFQKAKFPIAFTGAGISTSAGIPDFRSGMSTSLPTGPGVWEIKAHNKIPSAERPVVKRTSATKNVPVLRCKPTFTHMALVTLMEKGFLKGIISQNVDGLHLRSGIPRNQLAELHGNTNMEKCAKCKREVLHDTRVRNSQLAHVHKTGNRCQVAGCNGELRDTIINFGESLPEKEFDRAEEWVEQSDLCLVLGSSCTVTPAADLPESVGEKKNADLYIVNLQKTPLDNVATSRLNGITDTVMREVMKEMKIEVPEWQLVRYCRIREKKPKENVIMKKNSITTSSSQRRSSLTSNTTSSARKSITGTGGTSTTNDWTIKGIDSSGLPYNIFRNVSIVGGVPNVTKNDSIFSFNLPSSSTTSSDTTSTSTTKGFKCTFMGHYDEPPLSIPCVEGDYRLTLSFNNNDNEKALMAPAHHWTVELIPSLSSAGSTTVTETTTKEKEKEN